MASEVLLHGALTTDRVLVLSGTTAPLEEAARPSAPTALSSFWAVPSLPQLSTTLAELLDGMAKEANAVVVPRLDGMSSRATLQMAEALSDVDAAGRALLEAHRRAIRPYLRGLAPGRPIPAQDGNAVRPVLGQVPELATLSVLMKAWLFFVRAFCDSAYRLLLAEMEGRPTSRGGSMGSALRPTNPVAVKIASEAPELLDWFRTLREIRNDMKEGESFAFSGLDARGLALTIYEIRIHPDRPELIEGRTVTFADIADDATRILDILRLFEPFARDAGYRETSTSPIG